MEVCTYRLNNRVINNSDAPHYETSCGEMISSNVINCRFKICPYCGAPIKFGKPIQYEIIVPKFGWIEYRRIND